MAVGRFQVMATLQAARAHALGLPVESAYSWGLNRAIFYAAAKRGFKGGGGKGSAEQRGRSARPSGRGARPPPITQEYRLGDETAFKAAGPGDPRFAIGGKTQSKEDFERQIAARFQGKFKDAWEEAVDYVGSFDRDTLLSGSEFFASVYRPKRDELASKWTAMSEGASEAPSAPARVSRRKGVRDA